MQPYSMHRTVVLVAMDRASLQPAPATIRRCIGLLALMMAMYSDILTFSPLELPPRPKYLGWSFSQMPMMARMVRPMEITMPTGANTA